MVRLAVPLASLLLSACIISDRDLSQTYDPVFPARTGTYKSSKGGTVHIKVEDGYYVFNATTKYKVFKVPESDDTYILESIVNQSYMYSFASVDHAGVITIFDLRGSDYWRLSDELKQLVTLQNDFYLNIKHGLNTDQVIRTIAKLKIERDPASKIITLTPLDQSSPDAPAR